jgi:hypothetical protein
MGPTYHGRPHGPVKGNPSPLGPRRHSHMVHVASPQVIRHGGSLLLGHSPPSWRREKGWLAIPLAYIKRTGTNPSRHPIPAALSPPQNPARVGEALPIEYLHHTHHAIVLWIPPTSPPTLDGPGRRRHYCAARVHRSLQRLDRIGSWE